MTHNRRHRLAERDGWLCCWCSTPLRCQECDPDGDLPPTTIEHLIRRADGGTNDMSNLKLSCPPCNHNRHDQRADQRTPKAWDPVRRRFRRPSPWVDLPRIAGRLIGSIRPLPGGCPVCGLHNGWHDRSAHRLDRRIVP